MTKFVTNIDELNKLIVSIGKAGAKLNADIHKAAVSCVLHFVEHGNTTPATNLVNAMPGMVRKNALIAWFEHYSNNVMQWETKEDGKEKTKQFVKVKGKAMPDVTKATEWLTFDAFKPEPEYKRFDLNASIISLVKKAESLQSKEDRKNLDDNFDGLDALRSLIKVA